ncbi:putative ribosomal-protein-alanine acetyltransferase [Gleimia coleocanis DSM 15436]|uniref:Putative ribosomal-protein-alanine acetyltransferase n=1 Tax=Gleimia coleocanis DSM 15436 TaxID=525245 RepID=C0VZ47_9ACTO|nr:GNAT family N-acetyltransferase [Gleimia coleocanis]EEH64700.1 putative ribosomal-protein-alanine acetyltransferase [Gleimia coleocanis DSM 15436]
MLSFEVLTEADLFLLIELEQVIFGAEAWSESMLMDELTLPDRLYIGAYQGEDLLGYAGVRLGWDTDLMTVGVLPLQRGRGVGRALVKELLRRVASVRFAPDHSIFIQDPLAPEVDFVSPGHIARPVRRVERVILEVRESNLAAINLYSSLGFETEGHIKKYYRHPVEDALVMIMELTKSAPVS